MSAATPSPALLLPPDVTERLRAELPGLADEMLAVIGTEVPAYARPLEGEFGRGIRRGVQEALQRFLELAGGLERPDEPGRAAASRELYVALGRGEARVGRPLDALLSAYRVGARVTWSRLAELGLREGLPPDLLVQLAAAVFAYIDEISSASAAGHAAEQSHLVSERERRHEALARLLLGEAPAGLVDEAVTVAGWTPSVTLTPVLLADPDARRLAARWDERSLLLPDEGAGPGRALVLLPDVDGPGRAERLSATLAATGPSVLGPVRPWRESSTAAALVLRAAALQSADLLPGGRPLRVEQHLAALVVHADPLALAELGTVRLAPLEALTELARERMTSTLRSWLAHHGDRQQVAAELGIHPQTVRYRVGQLREVFGEQLEDPCRRLELALVTGAGLERG
jgi:hypothetical protein